MGCAEGAKTTPHRDLIDAAGKGQYAGAIDARRRTNPAGARTANRDVVPAFDELRGGKPRVGGRAAAFRRRDRLPISRQPF